MKNILFFSPYAFWKLHALYEVGLFHHFRHRGFNADYIHCNGLFGECDLYWEATVGPRPACACQVCQHEVGAFLQQYHLPADPLGAYASTEHKLAARAFVDGLADADLLRAEFIGHPLSAWIKSSVHTHLRINAFDLTNARHCRALRDYLYNGAVALQALRRVFAEKKPDVLVLFNGRMAYPRIALELALAGGVRVVCHERGIFRESLSLWENSHCLSLGVYEEMGRRWNHVPLTSAEVAAVAKWLADRAKGKNLNWRAYSEQGSLGGLGDFLRVHAGKKIAALLTSSTDEIIACDDYHCVFGSQQDWIDRTVAEFATLSDAVLVIRVHPNSGSKKSTGRNLDELAYYNALGARLPANVFLVMPEDAVSTYALMEGCDLGLVFGTTAALELAGRGKPVLAGARCPWTFNDAIRQVTDPDAYRALLVAALAAPLSPAARREQMRAAYRFIHAYLYRWHIPFPLVAMPDPHTGELLAKTLDDFRPGRHACLDHAAAIVLGERPLVPVPEGRSESDAEAETAALERYERQGGHRAGRAEGVVISAVVTCYNYADFLRPCVESIVMQTRPVDEIIIVDDGSTDASAAVAGRCIAEFPQAAIRLLRQPNSGQPALARNAGIQIARGDFILPVDADDRLDPGYIAACCEAIEDDPSAELVYADPVYVKNGQARLVPAGAFSVANMKRGNQLVYCSLYRRELWRRIGGYRDNIRGYEDWDFWVAAALLGAKAVHLARPGLLYNEKDSGVFSQTTGLHHQRVARLTLNNPGAFTPAELQAAARLLRSKGLDSPDVPNPAAATRFVQEIAALQAWRDSPAAWPSPESPEARTRHLAVLALAWKHRDWTLGAAVARRLVEAFGADPLLSGIEAACWKRAMNPARAAAAQAEAMAWQPASATGADWPALVRAEVATPAHPGLLAWALLRLARADLAAVVARTWRKRGIEPVMADLMDAMIAAEATAAPAEASAPAEDDEAAFTAADVSAVAELAAAARAPGADDDLRGQVRALGDECARRITAASPGSLRGVFATNFGSIWEAVAGAGAGISVPPAPVRFQTEGDDLWCRAVALAWLQGGDSRAGFAWEKAPLWLWEAVQSASAGTVRTRVEDAADAPSAGTPAGLAGKRILLYTDDAGQGGAAHYNHHLSLALRAAGAEVVVAQPKSETPMLQEQARAGIRHVWTAYDAAGIFPRSMTDQADAEHIFRAARPDLIYFSDSCAVSHLAAKRHALQSARPYMVICHSEAAYLAERFKACLPEVERLLAGAAEVLAVSESSRGVLQRHFGLAQGRGRVIYNGRPAHYFAPVAADDRRRIRRQWGVSDDTLVAFTAARFDSGKGYPFQIEAMKHLRAAGVLDRVRFVWVGDGEWRARIEAMVAEEKLSSHVRFLGYRWDVPELLAAADTFILPSLHEAMPLSIIEAMARGLPVIATAVGGIPEELGDTGQLLPDPNRDAAQTSRVLAQTLAAWSTDLPAVHERGRLAHTRAASLFRQERMLDDTLLAITETLRSITAG